MSNILKIKAVNFVLLMLFFLAVIPHVVMKDLLGLWPEYHLTSALLTVFAGIFLSLIYIIARGSGQNYSLVSARREELLDVNSTMVTIPALLLLGYLIELSGLYGDFHLRSAVEAVIFSGFLIWATVVTHRWGASGRKARKAENS